MKAIDKALELFDKFHNHSIDNWDKKQCALIAVDEILNAVKIAQTDIQEYWNYWQEVKQEIENL